VLTAGTIKQTSHNAPQPKRTKTPQVAACNVRQ